MHVVDPWILLMFSGMVAVALATFAVVSTRRLERIPNTGVQNLVELIVESMNNFVVGVIGPKGGQYTSLIGTLFIYILSMNLLGLIPGFLAPTSGLSITLSLAMVAFFAYNVIGIREMGFVKYAKHFVGGPLWLAWLMIPIHIIGDLARPISLSIRLFGNIFGEETVTVTLAAMTIVLVPYLVAIPTQFPMMLFSVFLGFVQALVFSTLTAVYISVAIADHEEH